MKRVAVTVLLLALLGLAACGDEVGQQAAPPWPPELRAGCLPQERVEHDALLAEAAERGIVVSPAEVEAFWMEWRQRDPGIEPILPVQRNAAIQGWRLVVLDRMRSQEGMTAKDDTEATLQRIQLMQGIIKERTEQGD